MGNTLFGNIHSRDDLELLQASFQAAPAEPRTSFLELEGSDGSLDLTEALGRVFYKDRTLSWIFKLYPGQDWIEKQAEVSNLLNGVRCRIVLDEDPEFYYEGRITVNGYKKDQILKQITMSARVLPWRFKQEETTISIKGTGSLYLPNRRKPSSPAILSNKDVTVRADGETYEIKANTATELLGFEIPEGGRSVSVEADAEAITSFTYQEADL